MKKSIILAGLFMLAMANVTLASNTSNEFTKNSSVVTGEYASLYATPLVLAITNGEYDVVKKFIEYGADVNEMTNGMTPLMYAARYNKVEIITLLIENGAKIGIKDKRGFTAIKHAELSNATAALEVLKSHLK